MEAKRKIKLEVIVGRKKIFEVTGRCDALYFDGNTKIYWKKQKPDYEKFGITLAGCNQTLEQTYNSIFLATNAKIKNSKNYQIKTTIGRVQHDS